MAIIEAGRMPGGGGGGGLTGRQSIAKSAVPSKEYLARKAAGITGNAGSNVKPIYKESIPPASVKVVQPSKLSGIKNRVADVTVKLRKSGEAARRSAADVNTGNPKTTIRINSNRIKPN